MKEGKKLDKIVESCQRAEKVVEHENVRDTHYS